MSKFNSKKKYEKTQTSGGGGSIRRMKFVAGVNIIRIVEDNFEDAWVHHFEDVEGNKKRAICLGKGKCPLCDKKKASHRFYFNVIDRVEQKKTGETKIKLMEVGKMIYEQIRDLALDEEYGDPTQYNLKINRKGEGLKTKYSVRASTKMYDLKKSEKEAMGEETEAGGNYDLSYFVQKQTKGQILEMLGEEVESEEDVEENENDQEDPKPKKKVKSNKPVDAEEEDDDAEEGEDKEELDIDKELEDLKDDEDDEEEEEPKPKKKCKKKTKVKDEDDEEVDKDEDDEEEDW